MDSADCDGLGQIGVDWDRLERIKVSRRVVASRQMFVSEPVIA